MTFAAAYLYCILVTNLLQRNIHEPKLELTVLNYCSLELSGQLGKGACDLKSFLKGVSY